MPKEISEPVTTREGEWEATHDPKRQARPENPGVSGDIRMWCEVATSGSGEVSCLGRPLPLHVFVIVEK